jgi:hypothetical protein
MTKKIVFIIFAHTNYQNSEDLHDLIDNINFFWHESDSSTRDFFTGK